MKKIKIMISVLLLICLTVCFTGCDARCGSKSDLKDNIVEGWNNWMQSFSEYVLTKENDLKGEKSRGDDAYTGTYTAVYDEFNGKELIFGGTALERENGNCLKVTYCLTVEEGNAALYWISGSDKYMIASDSSEDSGEYTISPGDNYYVFEGENFTGKLELTIEDVQN